MFDITISGDQAVIDALVGVNERIAGADVHLAEELATAMRAVVHVRSGYLRSTIHATGPHAVADAPYAGYEAARGGSHDFPAIAEASLDTDKLADWIVENF